MNESYEESPPILYGFEHLNPRAEDEYDPFPTQSTLGTNAVASPPPSLSLVRQERVQVQSDDAEQAQAGWDAGSSQGNDFAGLEAFLERQQNEVSNNAPDDAPTEEAVAQVAPPNNARDDALTEEAVAQVAEMQGQATRYVLQVQQASALLMQLSSGQLWNAASFSGILSQGIATLISSNAFAMRSDSIFGQRMLWDQFASTFGHQHLFTRHIRMKLTSFNKLLAYVFDALSVDANQANRRGGPIIPEICLFCAIRYLAGASYTDVFFGCGISKTAFYDAVWRTLGYLLVAPELRLIFPQSAEECRVAANGFRSISNGNAIINCVAVVDGYLLRTQTPSRSEVRNVRQYYSGHYSCYGVNVQAAFDKDSRFLYLAIAGPGSLGDRDALFECSLGRYIENLPGIYCAIGDCAYTPTEHMVPVFGGAQALSRDNDNFNFYASQLRIRAEMGFGLMKEKFSILQKPLSISMRKLRILMPAIARIHNFCVNERLARAPNRVGTRDENHGFTIYEQSLRDAAAQGQFQEQLTNEYPQWSLNRDNMVRLVRAKRLERPYANRR